MVFKNYTLIFPASSTWFSFSIDFLYLDFGRSPHVLSYDPRTFTTSIPEPPEYINLRIPQYLRPTFDEQLAKKVKNLAIANSSSTFFFSKTTFIKEFWTVFSGIEKIVLADQLHNICSEAREEFVWIRTQQEKRISPLKEMGEWNQEVEKEKAVSQCLRKLYLWRGTGHTVRERNDMDKFEQELERTAPRSRPIPTIIRNGITTPNIKKRLLGICGSEDNFIQLNGLDFGFVLGDHEYEGSLNQSQLLSFLEMALERKTTACSEKPGLGCSIYGGKYTVLLEVPELLDKIDALGGGFENIRLREAEECVWN